VITVTPMRGLTSSVNATLCGRSIDSLQSSRGVLDCTVQSNGKRSDDDDVRNIEVPLNHAKRVSGNVRMVSIRSELN
jgi:hypothetical protein